MNVGVSTACLYPLETEKALKLLCQSGVKNIEIFVNSLSEISGNVLTEIKSIIKDFDCRITSIHPYTSGSEPIMFFSNYQRRFLDGVEQYLRFCDFANELNANILVFHGDRKESNFSNEFYFERYLKLYREALKTGVYVCQENVCRCKSRSPEFLKAMSDALKGEVRFVFDLKQARRSDIPYRKYLDAMQYKIMHLHLSDFDEKSDCTLPNKNGKFDFASFLKDFKQSDITSVIEVYREAFKEPCEIDRSLEFLKNTLQI